MFLLGDSQPAVLDPQTGAEITGNNVEGVLAFKRAWPSIARTVYGDHKRYLDVYLNPYKVRSAKPIRFDSINFARLALCIYGVVCAFLGKTTWN